MRERRFLSKVQNMAFTIKEVCGRVLAKYGIQNQALMLGEEFGELFKAINKRLRNKTLDNKEIIEEMADLRIMLVQMEIFFDIDSMSLSEAVGRKIARIEQRLKDNCL